jgi:signal transduction histidine kinase
LGLCRRIVDHHGGDIGVEDPGDGRLGVWFTLPGPERETAGGPGT